VAAFVRVRPKVEALLEKDASERRFAAGGGDTLSRQELERERAAARDALAQTAPPRPSPRVHGPHGTIVQAMPTSG
jgi:hypothetical protein